VASRQGNGRTGRANGGSASDGDQEYRTRAARVFNTSTLENKVRDAVTVIKGLGLGRDLGGLQASS
jgi:hypothetical protein